MLLPKAETWENRLNQLKCAYRSSGITITKGVYLHEPRPKLLCRDGRLLAHLFQGKMPPNYLDEIGKLQMAELFANNISSFRSLSGLGKDILFPIYFTPLSAEALGRGASTISCMAKHYVTVDRIQMLGNYLITNTSLTQKCLMHF